MFLDFSENVAQSPTDMLSLHQERTLKYVFLVGDC